VLQRAVQLPLLQSAKSIGLVSSEKYLPTKAGLVPPKQAAGKVQRSKAALLLWHLDHPNFARTPDQVISPTHEAPTGHVTQSQSFLFVKALLRYSNSLQSDGFLNPSSWQELSPVTLLLYPVGHALQKELGNVF